MVQIRNVVLCVVFLASLVTPVILTAWLPESSILRRTPQVELTGKPWMRSFPRRFDAFFESHLGGRRALVGVHHAIDYWGFGISSTDAVVVGEKGWAFLNQDYMPQSLAGGAFAAAELDQWIAVFKATQDFVASWGGKLLVVVAPNKETIYPELLPVALKRNRGVARLDEFNKTLRDEHVEVLDLRWALADAKSESPTYGPLDTHWCGLGVLVASEQVAKRLARMTGKAVPFERNWFALLPKPHVGDLAAMMAIEHWTNNTVESPVAKAPKATAIVLPAEEVAAGQFVLNGGARVFSSENRGAPTVLVQHDSFGLPLTEVLPHLLGRSTWLYWTGWFNKPALAKWQPDVVVYLFAERYLHREPPALEPPLP